MSESSESTRTTDHDEIRDWVGSNGGQPARVEGTGGGGDAGLLRVDFGRNDEELEEISWDEFFEGFEANGLALVYQTGDEGDDDSRFSKLVDRED